MVLLMVGVLPGCTAFQAGREMMSESMKIFKPRTNDYRDVSQEEGDNWEFVGKEARGNRPLEDQKDPIRDLFMSPRAKAIERNLGYE